MTLSMISLGLSTDTCGLLEDCLVKEGACILGLKGWSVLLLFLTMHSPNIGVTHMETVIR